MGYEQIPQTVTVSDYTYNTIMHDIYFFKTDYYSLNLNKLLNLIVINYSNRSDADFRVAFSKYQEFYDAVKRRDADDQLLLQVKDYFRRDFYSRQNKTIHGERFRFTLTRKSVERLASIDDIPKDIINRGRVEEEQEQEKKKKPTIGYRSLAKYLSRLFESYSKLSTAERERIIFSDRYKMLEQIISSKTHSVKTIIKENTWLHVKPYKIIFDVTTRQNYLIGLSSADPENEGYNPAPFRINRLRNLQEDNSIEPINKVEIEFIEKRLKEVSPAYISMNAKEIKVKLSREGQIKMNVIVRNRPKIVQKNELENGEVEYTVYCTEFQAKNYFFQFGADAVVTEPKSLNEFMKTEFQKAADRY